MNDNNEGQEKKFNIKELFSNKQYRAILILVFYAILFVIIISSIRLNNNPIKVDNDNEMSQDDGEVLKGYELIHNNNFAYKYTVSLDDRVITYDGKKNGNKEEFIVSDGENVRTYYINDKDIFIKNADTYTKSDKPYFVFDFFDTAIVENILKGSIFDEEQQVISNKSLQNIVSEYYINIEDGNNTITVSYRNYNITQISLDLSNYSKAIGEPYNSLIITLEYYDFNLIDEIVG